MEELSFSGASTRAEGHCWSGVSMTAGGEDFWRGVNGARLCPEDQPQRCGPQTGCRDFVELIVKSSLLRLIPRMRDTAALLLRAPTPAVIDTPLQFSHGPNLETLLSLS